MYLWNLLSSGQRNSPNQLICFVFQHNLLPASLHQSLLFTISHFYLQTFAVPFSWPLLSAYWWLCSSSVVISLTLLSFLLDFLQRSDDLSGARGRRMLSCTPSVTRRDLVNTISFPWSFSICSLFIRALRSLCPGPQLFFMCLSPAFTSNSLGHWSENCPSRAIQVSVSAISHFVSSLEWKSFS